MIEYANYYDNSRGMWIRVAILQFEGNYAIVRNDSGKYLRIPIDKLQSD